jgi:NAD(P)-dependent dehydrogenase (short-subunit alcohol dehydrogenase family)
MRLSGSVALITGGAQGIGAEIARAYAREGARVAVADVQPPDAVVDSIRSMGAHSVGIHMDVTDEDSVAAGFAQAVDRLGPLNVVVNNAAIGTPVVLARDLTVADWERTMRINLTGTMLCIRESVRCMTPHRTGSIINIASNVAKRGLPNRSAYVSSKWAVLGLTQTVALETAEDGIRVNAICPGPVDTPHLHEVMQAHAAVEGRSVAEVAEDWRTSSPMSRFIETSEVAAVAVFLASYESSAMTGQAINVTGGLIMS